MPPKRLKVKSPTIEDMSNLSSCPSVITTPPTKPNRKNTPEYNIIKEPSTTHRENDIKPMTCKQDLKEQVSKQPIIAVGDQNFACLSPKQPNATVSMHQHYSPPMTTPIVEAERSPSIITSSSPSLPPTKAAVAFLRYMDALNALEYTYIKFALACKEHENVERKIAIFGHTDGGASFYDL